MSVLAAIKQILDSEQFGSVVSFVAGPALGEKAVVSSTGEVVAGAIPREITIPLLADVASLMAREQHRALEYGDHGVFIETLAPPPDLLIVGAVHVAQPLALFAGEMGYRVTITDARQPFATRERFPTANRVLVGWPQDLMRQIDFDRRTWVVILAHDSRHEQPILEAALNADTRYIGAMGSRRTHEIRVQRLREKGFSEDSIARIRGPVGLDIGAETPQEVAVSILAEMTMVRYGHGSGLALQGREGRVHLQRESR